MEEQELKNAIQVLLVSSREALTLKQLQNFFEEWNKPAKEQIDWALEALKKDYEQGPFELVESVSGYRVRTKREYGVWVARLYQEKPAKYSRALLETLAIIAYKQPVTRADIEALRGVAVNSQIMRTLLERDWIKVAGYRNVPGKPEIFTTTKEFLSYFNLQELSALPPLPDPVEPLIYPKEECVTE